jgi:hypothetical protein
MEICIHSHKPLEHVSFQRRKNLLVDSIFQPSHSAFISRPMKHSHKVLYSFSHGFWGTGSRLKLTTYSYFMEVTGPSVLSSSDRKDGWMVFGAEWIGPSQWIVVK